MFQAMCRQLRDKQYKKRTGTDLIEPPVHLQKSVFIETLDESWQIHLVIGKPKSPTGTNYASHIILFASEIPGTTQPPGAS